MRIFKGWRRHFGAECFHVLFEDLFPFLKVLLREYHVLVLIIVA
jgi:hypothetical protein